MNKEKTIKLSACLVLKNEGKTIYRCLDSIKDVVDEYIIGIDDTTDDNTVDEVCKFFNEIHGKDCYNADMINKQKAENGYGIHLDDKNKKRTHVYFYKWQDNFSKARNEGMDKATGDYILIMDGHEYFPELHFNITFGKEIKCRELLKNAKQYLANNPHDQGYVQLYQQPFNGQIPNNFFLQPRFYRNGFFRDYEENNGIIDLKKYKEDKTKKIRFNRAAHNTIFNVHYGSVINFDEIILIHDAPPDNRKERKEQRTPMNEVALKKMIQKNPDDFRAYFYLGNTYLEVNEWEKAIKTFNRYLRKVKGDHSEKYQAYIHKAICHKALKQWGEARDSLLLAIGIDPFRRDSYLILGDIYFDLKHYEKALKYYTEAVNIIPKPSRMFQNGPAGTFDVHQKLAFVYATMGKIPQAIVHLEQANKFFPNEKWVEQIKIWRDGKKNILIIDESGSFTNDFIDYLKTKPEYNVIKANRYDTRLCMWADKIWSEWANNDAYLCSKNFPDKTTVRLHGWEAYGAPQIINRIEWDKINGVFVCDHIKDKVIKEHRLDPEGLEVIDNGVNTDKFFIKEKNRNEKNIGYAGFINIKKNPFLLIQIIKANPDYTFHLRVDFQDPYNKASFDYELRDCKNVVFHDRYDDLNDFWNQMSCVLSTSIIESFSYNIAEAMACGCKPYIYNWNGAKKIWGDKWIFTDMPKFTKVGDRKEYRDYIIKNYPLHKSLKAMEKVLIGEKK
jgi:tetratricopeptide (TPR) repeat protein